MYIDIVIKELDELEKRKDRISSNNYLNQCNKLKKKYDLFSVSAKMKRLYNSYHEKISKDITYVCDHHTRKI